MNNVVGSGTWATEARTYIVGSGTWATDAHFDYHFWHLSVD